MKTNKFAVVIFLFFTLGINSYAQDQLAKLLEGNKRFVEGKLLHPNQSAARRTEVASGQKPFAVILTCSDSRVPPEIIFDQGLGDLFVIRTAGHVVDDMALASIEYAVEHLHAGLVVVLGHEKCGAVDAAVGGGELTGHLEKLIAEIEPAVEKAKNEKGDLLTNAVHKNVDLVVGQLKSSEPVLKEFVHHNELQIIGAYYDLDDGIVTMMK